MTSYPPEPPDHKSEGSTPPGGFPPPSSGGYPSPPPSAYPPPPPTGYGAPSPYSPPPGAQPYGAPGAPTYQAPGYGPAYGTPGQPGHSVTVGDAFNYGWTKFQQNVGPILLAALAYIAVSTVLFIAWYVVVMGILIGSAGEDGEIGGGGAFGLLSVMALGGLAFAVLSFVLQAGITRGALAITYGQPLTVGTMFAFDGLGQILLASVIVAVAASVGYMMCIVPGLVVLFFAQFVVHFILDKRLSAVDAIKASAGFVNRHVGTMATFFIASLVAYFIGSLLCGVGLLLAIPVVVIGQAFLYRRLQGEPVAA